MVIKLFKKKPKKPLPPKESNGYWGSAEHGKDAFGDAFKQIAEDIKKDIKNMKH